MPVLKPLYELAFQSTHPVRGATYRPRKWTSYGIFQSTHPVRGATTRGIQISDTVIISIHAPREGCDRPRATVTITMRYFNPRTP